jgi:nucleoside-triphosphatase
MSPRRQRGRPRARPPARPPAPHLLLLTGVPGVGKTTVLQQVANSVEGRPLRGFLTREIRSGGQRVGFRLHTLDGEIATLAHVDNRSRQRIGRYGVDISALNEVVKDTLCPADTGAVYLVDEIGTMECLSRNFISAVKDLVDARCTIVATVAARGTGFIEQIQRHRGAQLREVTLQNREMMPARVLDWLSQQTRGRRR